MMKSTLAIVCGLAIVSSGSAQCAGSIGYSYGTYAGTPVHAVYINLADPDVRVSVAIAKWGRGSSESFASLVSRTRPTAAITGTFFDTRTLVPTGDISLFGTLVHRGTRGAALCIDGDNHASIVSLGRGRRMGWECFETVVCAGPRLLSGGRICIGVRQEGFRASICRPARRTAAGITRTGKLVFAAVSRPVSLFRLAKALSRMGITEAVCLDGGSSAGLYCSGAYTVRPSRRLTNLLVAYSSCDRYLAARYQLAPLRLFLKAAAARKPRRLGLEPRNRDPFRRRLDAPRPVTRLWCRAVSTGAQGLSAKG